MADDFDGMPCDVEPNGGPCITPVPERRGELIRYDFKKRLGEESDESKYGRLISQLRKLEAEEREFERKKQLRNDILDTREKIKSRGEIPCA
jgi:hypothetical protein